MKLGICDQCARRDVWINFASAPTPRGDGQYCAECFERLGIWESRSTRKSRSISATLEAESPWTENAVRELEDAAM